MHTEQIDEIKKLISNLSGYITHKQLDKAGQELKTLLNPHYKKQAAHLASLLTEIHRLAASHLETSLVQAEAIYYQIIKAEHFFSSLSINQQVGFYQQAAQTLMDNCSIPDAYESAVFYCTAALRLLDNEGIPEAELLIQQITQQLKQLEVLIFYHFSAAYYEQQHAEDALAVKHFEQLLALADYLADISQFEKAQSLLATPWAKAWKEKHRAHLAGLMHDAKDDSTVLYHLLENSLKIGQILQYHQHYDAACGYYQLALDNLPYAISTKGEYQPLATRITQSRALFDQKLFRQPLAKPLIGQVYRKKLETLRSTLDTLELNNIDLKLKGYSEGLLTLAGELAGEIVTHLGEPPCAFTLVGLGSASRLELTPGSDLDVALLIYNPTEQKSAYFKSFISLLQNCLHLLGDRWEIQGAGKQSLGLHIDKSYLRCLQSYQLIREPKELAEWVANTLREVNTLTQDFILAYSLQWLKPIYNSNPMQSLADDYITSLREHCQLDKPFEDMPNYRLMANNCLRIHKAEFDKQLKDSAANKNKDLKKHLLAPLTYWCLDVASYVGIYPTEAASISVICKALEDNQLFKTSFLNYLQAQWAEITLHRLHPTRSALKEKAWVQALQVKLLQPAYQSIWQLAARREALEPVIKSLVTQFQACQHELLSPSIQHEVDACIEETRNYLQRYGTIATHNYLKRLCPELAWQTALQAMIQRLPVSLPKSYQAGFSAQGDGVCAGKVWLQALVIEKLFEPNGQLKAFPACEEERARYGRRPVIMLEHQGEAFHAKLYPEMPGVEEAVRLFDQLLFGHCVAQSELFHFSPNQKDAYPILFSQHVPGDNLQTLLNESPTQAAEKLSRLDNQCLSEQLLFTMLTNPEDGKPDNYILTPHHNSRGIEGYRLVCVDNDHAFVPPIIFQGQHRELQVKTILFCLDQMQEPLHPNAIEAFLKYEPLSFLRGWLGLLQEREQRYQVLFNAKQRASLWQRGKRWFKGEDESVVIPMCFAPRSLTHIYEKWLKMCEVLQEALIKQQSITPMALLRQAIPLVGLRYEEAFKKANPAERFYDLAATLYSTAIAGRYVTLKTGPQLIAQRKIPEAAVLQSLPEYSPKRALDELESARIEGEGIEDIRQELEKGSFERFQALCLDASKERVLQAIDFTKLSIAIQNKIINEALKGIVFHRLSIKECIVLTDKQLQQLLVASPGLLQLTLINCPEISRAGLITIADCPALRELTLDNLPKLLSLRSKSAVLRAVSPLLLPQLRLLSIERCSNISEISLDAPYLEELKLKALTNLTSLNLQAPQLKEWLLHTCPLLVQLPLQTIVAKTPLLASFVIQGCEQLNQKLLLRTLLCQHNQWTLGYIKPFMENDRLNLQGLPITDKSLARIAERQLPVKRLDLRGCNLITQAGLLSLIRHASLAQLKLTYYTAKGQSTVLTGHTSTVIALTILPDGRIVSGSLDKTLRLWDAASSSCTATLTGHTWSVNALAILTDGRIVSGSGDSTLRVWDAASSSCIATLKGHTEDVWALAILPDGRIVSGSGDSTLRIWDAASLLCLATLYRDTAAILTLAFYPHGHIDTVTALAILPDERIVSGSGDNTLRVWDGASLTCVAVLTGHTSTIRALAILPVGRIVSGSDDTTLRVWDGASLTCVAVLTGHTSTIRALAILPVGRIVSGSDDTTLRVWSFPDLVLDYLPLQALKGQCTLILNQAGLNIKAPFAAASYLRLALVPLSYIFRPLDLTWEATAYTLIIACTDIDKAYQTLKQLYTLQPAALICHTLPASIDDTEVKHWLEEKWPLIEINLPATAAITQKGLQKLMSHFLMLQILSGYNPASMTLFTLEGHTAGVTALAILPDGRIVSGSHDNTLRVWDAASAACLAILTGHTAGVTALAILPDGCIVSGSRDNTLRLWDATTSSCLATLTGHTMAVWGLAILPDGRIVSGSGDATLRLWDVASASCLDTLEGHTAGVTALAILPDGRIVSGSHDNTLCIWDGSTHKLLATLKGHTDRVDALAILPNGRIVSGSHDNTLCIWDGSTHKLLATLKGHTDRVSALAILSDGRIVSGSADKTLRVWDVASLTCVATLRGHTDSVLALAILADGRIVSGSWDKTLRVWDTGIKCLNLQLFDQMTPRLMLNNNELVINFEAANGAHLSIGVEVQGERVSAQLADVMNTYRDMITLCFSLTPAHTAAGQPIESLSYTCKDAQQAADIQAFLQQCWQNRQSVAPASPNTSTTASSARNSFWSPSQPSGRTEANTTNKLDSHRGLSYASEKEKEADAMQLNIIENKLKDLEKAKDTVENYAQEYQQLLKTKQALEAKLMQQNITLTTSASFY